MDYELNLYPYPFNSMARLVIIDMGFCTSRLDDLDCFFFVNPRGIMNFKFGMVPKFL